MKFRPNQEMFTHAYNHASGAKTFYKGTSFRCNAWEPNTRYYHNPEYIDFVYYADCLWMCLEDHLSSKTNSPECVYDKEGNVIHVSNSSLWEVVLHGYGQDGGTISLPGGNAGQVLMKASDADYDVTWGDAMLESQIPEITASGSAYDSATPSVDVVTNPTDNGYNIAFEFGLVKGADGKDGENGIDGNGLDFIFTLTEHPEIPEDKNPSALEAVQDDDYCPEGWTTYAQQVSATFAYQWVSSRKKSVGVWGTYSEPIIINNYNQEGLEIEVSYTSFVFCRSAKKFTDTDTVPTGGSYDNPYPTNSGTIGGESVVWYDSIPDGTGQVFMSSATFDNKHDYDGSEGEAYITNWSVPVSMSDTNDFQVEYSSVELPKTPESLQSYYDADEDSYEDNWRVNNPDWSDTGVDAIWMATCTMKNGMWSDWSVNKIKGEDGQDGTSVAIKGSYDSEEDLPVCDETSCPSIGDSYMIAGNLWVWDGDSWENVGQIQGPKGEDGAAGEAGDNAYIHIKYANIEWSESNKDDFAEDGYWSGFTRIADETPGETPGLYIGVYADHEENDSLDASLYKWTKWTGEDGWNYEYIYQRTASHEAPSLPLNDQANDYMPEGWSDNPVDVTEEYPYCWMCYRVKKDGIWSDFIGSADNPGYAALWAKWGETGAQGPQGEPGEKGEAGTPGYIIYPAGIWDYETVYSNDGKTAPYVEYEGNYYICTGESSDIPPSEDTDNWELMTQFNSVFTKLLVADNGTIGKAVYSGDFMFSQKGIFREYDNESVTERDSNDGEYKYFGLYYNGHDPLSNLTISEILTNSAFVPNILFDFKSGNGYLNRGDVVFNEGQIETKNLLIHTDESDTQTINISKTSELNLNTYEIKSFNVSITQDSDITTEDRKRFMFLYVGDILLSKTTRVADIYSITITNNTNYSKYLYFNDSKYLDLLQSDSLYAASGSNTKTAVGISENISVDFSDPNTDGTSTIKYNNSEFECIYIQPNQSISLNYSVSKFVESTSFTGSSGFSFYAGNFNVVPQNYSETQTIIKLNGYTSVKTLRQNYINNAHQYISAENNNIIIKEDGYYRLNIDTENATSYHYTLQISNNVDAFELMCIKNSDEGESITISQNTTAWDNLHQSVNSADLSGANILRLCVNTVYANNADDAMYYLWDPIVYTK